MINFKSESANKTQQNNAKILFGSKGVSVLAKLEMYSKEKALATEGINALLEVLKTKDATLLEKFASSKTGKTLAKNCKQLASAKSFDAIMKNIKQIKTLKSFDKFTLPTKAVNTNTGDRVGIFTEADLNAATKQGKTKQPAKRPVNTRLRSEVVKQARMENSLNDKAALSSFKLESPATFGPALDAANLTQRRKLIKQIVAYVKSVGNIPSNWKVNIATFAVDTQGYFVSIKSPDMKKSNREDDDVEQFIICLGGLVDGNVNAKKWTPDSRGTVAVIEQLDDEEYGKVKRMRFEKAIQEVVKQNSKIFGLDTKPSGKVNNRLPKVTITYKGRPSRMDNISNVKKAAAKAAYYYVYRDVTYLFNAAGKRVSPLVYTASPDILKPLKKLPAGNVTVK